MVALLWYLTLCAPADEVSLWRDNFDSAPLGALASRRDGWRVEAPPGTTVEVARDGDRQAACIRDDRSVADQPNGGIARSLSGAEERVRVDFAWMLRAGPAGGLHQDQGLMLLGGAARLLLLYFSADELRWRQDETWASLPLPLRWSPGQWLTMSLDLDLAEGRCHLSANGRDHGVVPLTATGRALTDLRFVSQRYARGELWVDDVAVTRELPAALRGAPSAAWRAATPAQRERAWFADPGGTLRGGQLTPAPNAPATARRQVRVDLAEEPVLRTGLLASAHAAWKLLAWPAGEVPCTLASGQGGACPPIDLFAQTAWTGRRTCDLIVTVQGGPVTLGELAIDTMPAPGYTDDPDSVWRYRQPLNRPNRLDVVPLEVRGPPGTWPLRGGLPFPAGRLTRPSDLRLATAAGAPLPLQTQVLTAWPDGSVRWLLLDSVADLPADGRLAVRLTTGERPPVEPPLAQLLVAGVALDLGGDRRLVLPAMGFGAWQLDGERPWDLVARFGDTAYRASQGEYRVRVETNGPVRATVVISGTLANGTAAPFTYELRVTAWRGHSRLGIEPTITLVAPEPAEIQLQELALELPGSAPPGPVVVGGDRPYQVTRSAGSRLSLLQDSLDHWSLRVGDQQAATGRRAAGWLQAGSVFVAVRRFAPQFAKELTLTDAGVRVALWSPAAPPRRFGRGAAKTHRLLWDVAAPADAEPAALAAELDQPVTLHAGARWYADSRALGPLAVPGRATAQLDQLFERALNGRIGARDQSGKASQDMVNDGEIGSINAEIDAPKAFWLQWLRTGERRWFDFAADWAQHNQDLDVCWASPNPREVGLHHSHYGKDHSDGSLTLSHTWIEGQLLRYYLTGDRRSLLAADLAGRAFAHSQLPDGRYFDAGQLGSGVGSRVYGRACWALCALFEATGNPRYVEAMRRGNGYLTASLRADGAVPGSHNAEGVWNPTDECPHMAAINAVGLARYTQLTGDRQFVPALERIARWQVARGSIVEKLGILYHTYPGGEVLHFVDASANMLEAWARLHELTGLPVYRDLAESGYDAFVEQGERWVGDWTMGVVNALTCAALRETWAPPRPAPAPPGPAACVAWLQRCQNPDGGFAAVPGAPSDVESVYRALDALRRLHAAPADPAKAWSWLASCRNADGGYATEPGWHSNVAWTWCALAALRLLDAAPAEPATTVAWLQAARNDDGGSGASKVTGPLPYHPGWQSGVEYTACRTRALRLLAAAPEQRDQSVAWVQGQQVNRGGFRQGRSGNHGGGGPVAGYTLDALQALAALDASPTDAAGCAAWLAGLRRPDGGYGWVGGDHATLRNTTQAVLALRQLGQAPADPSATIAWVHRCQAAAGGFGHEPGRTATVMSTWCGVAALTALGAW